MGRRHKKPHSRSVPASIGAFSLVENQVTFKLENVFFFTVIFARVGFSYVRISALGQSCVIQYGH